MNRYQIKILKETLAIIIFFFYITAMRAEVLKTVNLTAAGALSTAFTNDEKTAVTRLKVTGTLNSDDIEFMHYNLPELKVIDMSGATIINGVIPGNAFSRGENGAKVTLDSIFLPANTMTVGSYAFAYCTNLKSIELPSTVKEIGDCAFFRCTGMTSVVIPASLKNWGFDSFSDCDSLKSVTFKPGLTNIGNNAFALCTNLKSVSIPSSVVSIAGAAFISCDNLVSVKLSNGLDSIGDGAFSSCISLDSLFIPASVRHIGDMALIGCGTLTVDPENTYLAASDGVLFNKDKTCLIHYPYGKKGGYIIPVSVKMLANGAFCYCQELSSIELPSGITNIGEYAFGGCTGLPSLNIPAALANIGGGAFALCHLTMTVDPENPYFDLVNNILFSDDKTTLFFCPSSESGVFIVPESVDTIAPYAFYGCTQITSFILPSGLKKIGESSFYGCDGITSIYFSSSTPPEGDSDIGYIDEETCTLYVPKGSLSSYKEAVRWRYYKNIVEWDVPTAVQKVDTSAKDVVFDNGLLKVRGVSGETLSICTLGGKIIFDQPITSPCDLSIKLPGQGLYLVRLGNKCFKVIY